MIYGRGQHGGRGCYCRRGLSYLDAMWSCSWFASCVMLSDVVVGVGGGFGKEEVCGEPAVL